jgi:hypothetical protein
LKKFTLFLQIDPITSGGPVIRLDKKLFGAVCLGSKMLEAQAKPARLFHNYTGADFEHSFSEPQENNQLFIRFGTPFSHTYSELTSPLPLTAFQLAIDSTPRSDMTLKAKISALQPFPTPHAYGALSEPILL